MTLLGGRPLVRRAALIAALVLGGAGCGPSAKDRARLDDVEARLARMETRLAKLPAGEHELSAADFEELALRLDSTDVVTRYRAATELSSRGEAVERRLIDLVRTGTPRQKESAAAVLSGLATADAVPNLVVLHDAATSDSVRALLATALGHAGRADALDPLVADLDSDAATVRIAALLALGKLHDPRAAAALLRFALADGPESVMARQALRDLGPQAILFVTPAWQSLRPAERRGALEVVGSMEGDEVNDFLRAQLADASPLVALAAAQQLAQRGDPAGRAVAVARLGNDNPQVSRAARQVLDTYEADAAPR